MATSPWGKTWMMSMVLGTGRLYRSELMTFHKHFSFPSCQVKRARPNEGQYTGVISSVSLTLLRRTLSVSLGHAAKMGNVCQRHRVGSVNSYASYLPPKNCMMTQISSSLKDKWHSCLSQKATQAENKSSSCAISVAAQSGESLASGFI